MAAVPAWSTEIPGHIPHLDWGKVAPVGDTVPALLRWAADNVGDVDVYVADADRVTYREADRRSAELGRRLLAHGVGKGARVGMLLPNSSDFLNWWLAIVRIGAVAVPISTMSAPAELGRILRSSGICLLVAADRAVSIDLRARIDEALGNGGRSGVDVASPVAPSLRHVWFANDEAGPSVSSELLDAAEALVKPADEMTIIYTSGSTSEPKGVLHSQGTMMRCARKWCASMPYLPGDRLFSNSPLFWVGGLITSLLAMMHVGGTTVTSESRDTGALLDVIERERCTLLQVWPALAISLAQHPSFAGRDFSAMRDGSVLEMLPPESRPRNRNPFGFAMGMTETSGPHTLAMKEIDDDHRGAMGLLAPGMEHRLVDPDTGALLPDGEYGELHVRGDTLMLGYVGRERGETFDADGWFATGDICTIRDGHLFFQGRQGAMIKTAGANVAPAEVEAALVQAKGVGQAHVVGVSDPVRGELVGALLVPAGPEPIDVDVVLGTARALLSPYKVPRRVLVVNDIPLTGTNKLDRRTAAQWLKDGAPTSV